MRYPIVAATATFAFVVLAACGGGGSVGVSPPGANPSSPPSGPSVPATMPQTATVGNGQAYVSSSNQHTLYTWAGDSPGGASKCTSASGCTGIWPPYAAPSGTVAPAGSGFGIVTRSDGTLQWSYQNYPLYYYSGDSAAGQGNGNGINSFGAVWGIARPAGAAPGPTSPPSGCVGYYC